MKVVPIILTYNEKENIGPMLDAWLKIAKENPKYTFEPLVVDDQSPDGTGKIVKEYAEKHKNIHLLSGARQGYGKALMRGYKHAIEELKAEVVIPIDVDFQWDPFIAPKLLAKIDQGYDVVVPSRAVPGSSDDFTGFRKFTHWFSDTLLAYYLAGIHEVKDHAGSFKAIRVKDRMDKVDLAKLDVKGFVIQMKTIYELSKTGAKFCEIPAHYGERKAGTPTTVGLKSLTWFIKYVIEYIKVALQIRLERSKIFFRFAVVGGIGFVINSLGLELFYRLGFSPGLAAAFGAEFAIVSNFTLNNLWTFSEKKIKGLGQTILKFLQFNLTSLGAIVIQAIVVGILAKFFGDQWRQIYLVIAVGFFVIPYNYTMYNVFIWKTWKIPFLSKIQKKI